MWIFLLNLSWCTVSSKASRSFVVISAITALYLLNLEQAAIQWFWINRFFGMAGQSESVVYTYANVGPIWSYLVTNINGSLLATVADSLLVRIFTLWSFFYWLYLQIWRCYNLWNNSARVILVPSALLLIEIGNTPVTSISPTQVS